MRKFHRAVALVAGPFVLITALTGLLWAYAPHLYLKRDAAAGRPKIDESAAYIAVTDAIRAAKALAGEGGVAGVSLRPDSGKLVYAVNVATATGLREVWVDPLEAKAEWPARDAAHAFHQWVMKLHRLSFFGVKKELVIVPGAGLLLLTASGVSLLRRPKFLKTIQKKGE